MEFDGFRDPGIAMEWYVTLYNIQTCKNARFYL